MEGIKGFEPLWGVWRTEKLLGKGSYGCVYLALREDYTGEFRSAVKHISLPADESELRALYDEGVISSPAEAQKYYARLIEELTGEIRLMYRLRGNRNVVAYEDHLILEKKETPGYDIFIRMELLNNLSDYARAHPLTPENICRLGMDICSALEALSRENIIHRDIKPANILVDDAGVFKLGDFGVARQIDRTSMVMSKKGTYTYMSPEVYNGEAAGETADIYSLGLVMHRFLNNNRAPFLPIAGEITYADQELALARRIRGEELIYPAYAPPALGRAICKACAFSPKKRFQSPTEFREVLEGCLYTLQAASPAPETERAKAEPSAKPERSKNAPNAEAKSAAAEAKRLAAEQAKVEREAARLAAEQAKEAEKEARLAARLEAKQKKKEAARAKAETPGGGSTAPKGEEPKGNRRFIRLLPAAAALALLAALLIALPFRFKTYWKAEALAASGEYWEAYALFASLEDYRDAQEKAKESRYREAAALLDAGEYDEAKTAFKALEGYGDSQAQISECEYRKACSLLDGARYDEAQAIFKALDGYGDAAQQINECQYQTALALCNSGNYADAMPIFKTLGEYKDSAGKIAEYHESVYQSALSLLNAGQYADAAALFSGLKEYKDSHDRLKESLAPLIKQAAEYSRFIYAGYYHTVGLKKDGTVVVTGKNNGDVSGWKNIIAVSGGASHTVGLKADGTVVAVDEFGYTASPSNVSGWRDIVAISAGYFHTVGLKADGTAVAVGDRSNGDGRCNVSDWGGIVAISVKGSTNIGLKADGTVVVSGDSTGHRRVSLWRDIIAVSTGGPHTVGLKADGTVVAVGFSDYGQCSVSAWKDIIAISAGGYHTVALKADGTVVATGDNTDGQCNVSDWKDIVAVSAGYHYTVGLKADGTVVAVGNNEYGQCNVSGWDLF